MLGSRSRVEWWTAALVSAIAWLALSSTWLGGHLIIPYDAKAHFQAQLQFLATALHSGQSPFWTPRLAAQSLPQVSPRRRAIELFSIAVAFAASLAVAISSGHGVDAIKPLLIAATLLAAALAVLQAIIILAEHSAVAAIAIVAVFMTVDLALNNGPNESTALSAAQYEILRPNCKNETVRFLKANLRQPPNSARRDRVELVGLGFAWPNLGLVHGFDHVLGYNPLRLEAADKAMGAGDTIAGWEQRPMCSPGRRRSPIPSR
jgi:hypothetical protein